MPLGWPRSSALWLELLMDWVGSVSEEFFRAPGAGE